MKVILLHGFNKNSKDMATLQHYLTERGYDAISFDLPLTYGTIEEAVVLLEKNLEPLFQSLKSGETVHFIGHSTGGLIIRKILERTNHLSKIGRCVLIATPNHGTKIADIGLKVHLYANTFKTVQALHTNFVLDNPISPMEDIEVAAIAGNKNKLLLGHLLRGENDGRVEVESVYYPELSDFLVLPYGHKDIHHQKETAQYVRHFLETGKFKK